LNCHVYCPIDFFLGQLSWASVGVLVPLCGAPAVLQAAVKSGAMDMIEQNGGVDRGGRSRPP
jgi:hypothetical protein